MDLDKLVIKSKINVLKQIHVKTNINYRDIKIIYKSIKLKSALFIFFSRICIEMEFRMVRAIYDDHLLFKVHVNFDSSICLHNMTD